MVTVKHNTMYFYDPKKDPVEELRNFFGMTDTTSQPAKPQWDWPYFTEETPTDFTITFNVPGAAEGENLEFEAKNNRTQGYIAISVKGPLDYEQTVQLRTHNINLSQGPKRRVANGQVILKFSKSTPSEIEFEDF